MCSTRITKISESSEPGLRPEDSTKKTSQNHDDRFTVLLKQFSLAESISPGTPGNLFVKKNDKGNDI